ncbi:hypothetical protein [Longimicrobium sp.]|uniref:hypothetical protein n=1 Tax=Longimicrobium sp. TaxID=2029185 RepID=UPI002E375DDD|nr:hypothetical protein [Longimicrobium sp.]HEX6038439.1 hypothetical protein [Longimicrobium sp.]
MSIAASVEEKFGILLGNYEELETALLIEAAHKVIFQDINPSRVQDMLYTLNRRVINLLTSCRLYIDHIQHDLNSIFGKASGRAEVAVQAMNYQYDVKLGYRVMEALRNYVQHRGLPIAGVLFGVMPDKPRVGFAAHTVTPLLNTHKLDDDGGFKQSVLNELMSAHGEQADLKPLVREYIEGITEVHRKFREIIAVDVKQWESTLMREMAQRCTLDGGAQALAVVHTDDAGHTVEEFHLYWAFLMRRRELEQRMPLYTPLRKPVVTSDADDLTQMTRTNRE